MIGFNDSGIAATAKATASNNESRIVFPWYTYIPKINTQRTTIPRVNLFPNISKDFCNGVIFSSVWSKRVAIFPSCVLIPVSVIKIFALP